MPLNILNVEGIGPRFSEILKLEGIDTVEELLQIGCSKKGREDLSYKTTISEKAILNWVNICDLFRINGIAGQYAELLKGSGVDTIKELRKHSAVVLAAKMSHVNKEKNLCEVSPNVTTVRKWIEQAKILAPMITLNK